MQFRHSCVVCTGTEYQVKEGLHRGRPTGRPTLNSFLVLSERFVSFRVGA